MDNQAQHEAEYDALCAELGMAPDYIDALRARCDKLEAALTTLIDDIYATHAIDEGNGDYGPYLDLAQEHADEAKALLAEVQDGS